MAYVFLVTIALLPECYWHHFEKNTVPKGKVILSQNAETSQDKQHLCENFYKDHAIPGSREKKMYDKIEVIYAKYSFRLVNDIFNAIAGVPGSNPK